MRISDWSSDVCSSDLRIDAHDVSVGGQGAGARAEDDPAAGEVVEQADAVGQQPRVVVGQRDHAGAELDVLGALGRHRDDELGAADQLVAAGVVLTEPALVERSEEHTSELQSLMRISYAVFGLKKKTTP